MYCKHVAFLLYCLVKEIDNDLLFYIKCINDLKGLLPASKLINASNIWTELYNMDIAEKKKTGTSNIYNTAA